VIIYKISMWHIQEICGDHPVVFLQHKVHMTSNPIPVLPSLMLRQMKNQNGPLFSPISSRCFRGPS
jgi:hypothetical protein